MGEHNVKSIQSKTRRAEFINHLLNDVKALEYMLENDLIESGITRIGAEQEFCLVTPDWRPANNALKILEDINDDHFTTELALYNLEINLDPVELKGKAFSQVENQLHTLLDKARKVARKHGTDVLLTGILPTISYRHLKLDYITPSKRYWTLNDMLKEVRGNDFQLHLRGVDELSIVHDSVLFEACNTSFQLHLQIDPADFISSFNWAQAIAGPVLAVSTNSPLLLGRELWNETRIALFQQSIDTRSASYALKDERPRVSFGSKWATGTIADIYKDNISEYPVILSTELEGDSYEKAVKGEIPSLRALNLHNGTLYPWNRACYGVGGGKAHVRIENRYIPSGPSTADEMANFVFWVGLMAARPEKYDDMPSQMDFKDAKANFLKAARIGKDSIMSWEGKRVPAEQLVLQEFLPLAHEGLKKLKIDKADIERFLGLIEARAKGQTGSKWMIHNYRNLSGKMKKDNALRLITRSILKNQEAALPVHRWENIGEEGVLKRAAQQVAHIMSTRLFTVREDDLARLATEIMSWKNIHHVPVKDGKNRITGILTWNHVRDFEAREGKDDFRLVRDIMNKEVITIKPEIKINQAIGIMKTYNIGCLPVVQKGELVGIITINDVLAFDDDQNL